MNIFNTIHRYLKYFNVSTTVEKYCMFIGYPRSGHTLVRSMLDAHPNIILANEEDALFQVEKGRKSRNALYAKLLRNSYNFVQAGNTWTEYSYAMPNGFQGTYTNLRIIGDKKGGKSTQRLRRDESLLTTLYDIVQVPIVVLHCIRNPYDNITSMAIKSDRTLDTVIQDYTERVQFIDSWRKRLPTHVTYYEINHEQLVLHPDLVIRGVLDFLGMPVPEEYIEGVRNMVHDTPHAISKTVTWNKEQTLRVQNLITTIPFLTSYAEEK